ncbi:hydrolase (plasmid) [Mesorhizobium sp. 131-2-5]|uniref:CocE/NonD family hydrolase n=1 Tax=Mesorhizobium sp. 131-2-5 TaxID=2744519 RepID=UPI0018ED8C38|nr:CocE/NonD family hydrolase [Mesorhizobium sp. 131-2-5]BCH05313.1 hydrolase [Mesorhizobium sp. 131-2-5]
MIEASLMAGVPIPQPLCEQVGEFDVVAFPKPHFEVELNKDVRVPMRDGVGLYADIYQPRGAGEKLPTILIRTQYDKTPYQDGRDSKMRNGVAYMFAGQGFTVVVQDARGRFRSEGNSHPAAYDADDGYDTVGWVAAQPWSDGKVGTYGCSFLGLNQVMMAPTRPRALAAMVPQGPAGGMRNNPYDIVNSGVPAIGWAFRWFRELGSERGTEPLSKIDYDEVLKTLPLADMMDGSGRATSDWREWVSNEPGDPYWRQFALFDEKSCPNVPALFVNSWYDPTVGATLDLYNAFQNQSLTEQARRNQYVIISATEHCRSESAKTPYMVGERDVGDVRCDHWSIYLRWYDHWLRGGQADFKMPHVQYYLMGANKWKSADSWPIPDTRFVPYYFSSDGKANTSEGGGKLSTAIATGPADHYCYDPADPVPSKAIDSGGGGVAADVGELDLRSDRLVFTTEPLKSGVEVTGPLRAVLYVSSSAVDTDFVVQLSDVYPDGRVYNLRQGIARTRYRDAYSKPERYREDYSNPRLMTPGKVYRIEVNMEATGNWFAPGHRIRVQVCSSLFPHWARNLNTGGNNGTETRMVVAQNTIHHDRNHPSHILLPIVP